MVRGALFVVSLFIMIYKNLHTNCPSHRVVAIRCAVTTINATVGGGVTAIIYSLWRTQWKLVIPDHVINGKVTLRVTACDAVAYSFQLC